MFTNNFKLDGIENILDDIGYLDEMKGAGEDQEHKYTKKSGKKSKDYDGDGTVEDETDEYAGVKDRAIKKATGKCSKCDKEPCECDDTKKESVDFSSVLDELTDEDLLFLSDDLIEEVVEEFFYETLEEGFEIDELETLLIEQVESELTYLEEAKVTVGHDSDVKPEASRTSKLAKVKDAVKKVASGAKAVAKKVAGAAGEVAGSAVAGYKKASAAAKDAPESSKSEKNDSKSDSPNTGSRTTSGTKRPGILGRVGAALKSGLKKAIHGAGKVAGKVVKTAKAGYDEGRGKSTPVAKPAAKPAANKPAAKPVAKTATAKKKAGGNLDNLLNQIRNEAKMTSAEKAKESSLKDKYDPSGMKASMKKQYGSEKGENVYFATIRKKAMQSAGYEPEGDLLDEAGKLQGGGKDPCWKGYEMVGMKKKGGREVPNCVPKEEYEELYLDMIEEGYTIEQVREVLAAYEDGFEVIFEEDGVTINETQEVLDEEFLSDVEMVADWLYAEGVIENEDQFFELMEDLSEEEIQEIYDLVLEATAMAKRGYDETKLRSRAGGGEAADRASALEKKPTYGDANKTKQRQNYARAQRGDYRKTASSNPGLHAGQHKSNDPKVKAKQAARGAQRGALTPKEKKDLNMGYEMIGNSLEEGGLEVRNYSWKEVMESQYARNNPEKYEAEQKKKTSKSAMPPRGDKRREDFEKWYAANVR
jgi:hypothetical protein